MSLPIRLIISLSAYSSFIFGTLFNSILLFLAKRHSTGELKSYRWVLFYFGLLNYTLLGIQTVGQQMFFMTKSQVSYNFVLGLAARLPSIYWYVGIYCLYVYCATLHGASLAIQIFDRYFVICRSDNKKQRRYFVWMAIALFFDDKRTTTQLLGDDDIFSEQDNGQMAFFLETSTKQNILVCIFYTCTICGSVLMYCAIIFCIYRLRTLIYENMLRVSNIRSNEMMKQILNNMLIQAFVPFYCVSIGLLCILFQLIGNYSSVLLQLEMLAFVPLHWLPVLNPLVTVLTIQDYRTALVTILKCGRKNNQITTVSLKPTLFVMVNSITMRLNQH
uniref:Gustatory receptor n=1 Tax=Globodera rostochiensis TaxID=31243 RepID=A0A914HSS7_GLORO